MSEIPWAVGIRAFRRAGFVCAAESPASVILVGAHCSVILQRQLVLDEGELRTALRVTRLAEDEFLKLLAP